MLCELFDLMESPTTHACIWRDGELYIEPAAASPTQFVIPAS